MHKKKGLEKKIKEWKDNDSEEKLKIDKDLNSQKEGLERKLKELGEDFDSLQEQYNELMTEQESLQAKYDDSQNNIYSAQEENEHLRPKLKDTEIQLGKLQEALKTKENETKQQCNELQLQKNQLEDKKEKLASSRSIIEGVASVALLGLGIACLVKMKDFPNKTLPIVLGSISVAFGVITVLSVIYNVCKKCTTQVDELTAIEIQGLENNRFQR